MTRRALLESVFTVIAALIVGAALAPQNAAAEPAVFTDIVKGVAVGGYDTVTYFKDGKAVPGKPEFTAKHLGVDWRFSSAANLATFTQEPAKYTPQYGGHCAFASASGGLTKGDPTIWKIVNGKLYLNLSQSIQQAWEQNPQSFIAKGDANWSKLK